MNELTDTKLKRPMDPAQRSNDAAMLRSLTGLLNNPEVTGAKVPVDVSKPPPESPIPAQVLVVDDMSLEKTVVEKVKKALDALPDDSPVPGVTAQVKAIFFTGHPKSGRTFLAKRLDAELFDFEAPIRVMASRIFHTIEAESYLRTMFAWGNGEVSPSYPLTAERALCLEMIRSNGGDWEEITLMPASMFGTPDFWTRSLIARATQFQKQNPDRIVAVPHVETPMQHRMLTYAGYKGYHVLANSLSRSARGGGQGQSSILLEGINRDITRRLSEQPQGKKLMAVWCDEKHAPPSPRLLTVSEFVQAIKG